MKTTKEIIQIMQAYERGEQIEFCYTDEVIKVWQDTNGKPLWNWGDTDYRVKPKPEFRPFKSVDEFLEAQKEHGIEVKNTLTNTVYNVFINSKGEILMRDKYSFTFIDNVCEMFGYFTFLDGTPCGKEVKV